MSDNGLAKAVSAMKDRKFYLPVKKELQSLEMRLRPDEAVEALLSGKSSVGPGLVALTSERVIMIASGSTESYREWDRASLRAATARPKKFLTEPELHLVFEGEPLQAVKDVIDADAARFAAVVGA